MSSKQSFLTISVDDGHPTDLRTAELVSKYGLKATLNIPANNNEQVVMKNDEIRSNSTAFEIGGHTFKHLPLHKVNYEVALQEIVAGKKWLEDITGTESVSFCYPQGKINLGTPALVKKAGFLGARTCMYNRQDFPNDPYLWGVSTHSYSHSRLIQMRHAAYEANLRGLLNCFTVFEAVVDWKDHFHKAVEKVSVTGGIAHLYFHNWEIEANEE